jgi:lysozyme
MNISRKGAMAILADEGIVLRAYQCSAGAWTIGVGHTAAAGRPAPRRGMTMDLDAALALFRKDVRRYEAEVLAAVKRPLSQNEFDALVSFHFNTGAISSGSIDDKLNHGNVSAAIATMRRYGRANGKTNRGLAARREREIALFLNGEIIERGILVENPDGSRRTLWPRDIAWPGDTPPPPDIEPPPPPETAPRSFWRALLDILLSVFRRTR